MSLYLEWIKLDIFFNYFLDEQWIHSALVRGGSVGSQEPTKFWKSLSLNVWDGMIWNPGNPHTRIPKKGPVHDFLFHFIYLKILFEDLVWRSCLKILFEDFIQYKGHYREKKLWLKLINSKELKALLLKTREFWMKNDIISSPFLILKIYFEDLFWRYILSILKQHPSNLQNIRLCQDANVIPQVK